VTIYPNDIVYCRVRGNTVVSLSGKWDGEIPFVIIGMSTDGFYILRVPKYYNIRHSWKIDKDHANDCNIDDKYLGHKALAVPLEKFSRIIRKTPIEQDGMACSKCKKFYHMAEGNQDDGSLICYSCRSRGF
jgi:hypothetical protein